MGWKVLSESDYGEKCCTLSRYYSCVGGDVYEKKMDSSVDDNADPFDAWYCIMRKSDHL